MLGLDDHFIPLTFFGLYVFLLCNLLTQRKAKQVCTESAGPLILAVIHPCDFPLIPPHHTAAEGFLYQCHLAFSSCPAKSFLEQSACRIPFHCVGKHSLFTSKGGKECQATDKNKQKIPKHFISTFFWLLGNKL